MSWQTYYLKSKGDKKMYIHSSYAGTCRGFWRSVEGGQWFKIETPEKGQVRRSKFRTDNSGCIVEQIDYLDNRKASHFLMGEYDKTWDHGKLIELRSYRKGTIRGRAGKQYNADTSVVNDRGYYRGHNSDHKECDRIVSMSEMKGKCYTEYYGNGQFKSQKMIYHNRRKAFEIKNSDREVTLKDTDGSKLMYIKVIGDKVKIDTNTYWRNGSFISAPDTNHCKRIGSQRSRQANGDLINEISECYVYDQAGEVVCFYRYRNGQKDGELIHNYETKYFLAGVEVAERIYKAKPEDLNGKEILDIDNAQLKASLIRKVGMEKILNDVSGELVDQDGDMELFKIPTKKSNLYRSNDFMMVLKVRCPTTGTYYALRTPPDITKCEMARQWTFGIDPARQTIDFALET